MGSSFVILVVDNSKFIRSMLCTLLKRLGYDNVVEAVDGKDALDALMEYEIDLIISGLYMPKVNGLELLKALMAHSTLKHIPFIILTSDVSSAAFKEAMKIGAADYIKKPFVSSDITSKIESITK